MFPLHVAVIRRKNLLFLRKQEEAFGWFLVDGCWKESATSVVAKNCAEAIALGYRAWKEEGFRLMHCGFRYTLPERDQVGSNALFWQMALSYNSPNGRYFDEDVGHLCYVDFASHEALELWRKIKASVATNV